ncbi:uncharacterized protein Ibf1 isoform X2 [Drosophila tropicalis]|uniref:uncharacterized protein Ibf1 isoform X2 n=1 Tax=Drosophila tropicalis TaxID=46794 RepID=UPI0035AB8648
MPRKKSEQFYKEHGFLPRCVNGKYSAICKGCDKELFNTALSRLLMHKQNCDKKRTGFEVSVAIDSIAKDPAEKVKLEGVGSEDEEMSIEVLEYNENDYFEDGDKTPEEVEVYEQEEQDTDTQRKRDAPSQTAGCQVQDENKIDLETECSKYFDIVNENFGARTAPKSGSLAALKADKVRAQIRQFQSKTQFLKTETDNLKLERTLALLKIQKLRLEIDSLRAYS